MSLEGVKMTYSNALKCVVSNYEQKIGDFTQTKLGGFNA